MAKIVSDKVKQQIADQFMSGRYTVVALARKYNLSPSACGRMISNKLHKK